MHVGTSLVTGESRVSRLDRKPSYSLCLGSSRAGRARTQGVCSRLCPWETGHLNLEGECWPSAFWLWDASQGQ